MLDLRAKKWEILCSKFGGFAYRLERRRVFICSHELQNHRGQTWASCLGTPY